MEILGILGAIPEETALLFAAMQDGREETCGGVTFYEGTLAGKRAVLCSAGMGKVNAAAATQLLITRFGATAIVFSGIAGNMTDKIGVGDMVIGQTVVYHDADMSCLAQSYPFLERFTADPRLVQAAETACQQMGMRYIIGVIATGDQFVGDAETKRAIAAKCAPDCVEMEGAAVAHVAAKNDVPFVVLRAMSDNCDTALEELRTKQFSLVEYCHAAARLCETFIKVL